MVISSSSNLPSKVLQHQPQPPRVHIFHMVHTLDIVDFLLIYLVMLFFYYVNVELTVASKEQHVDPHPRFH
jgi:hypothetical protein